MPMQASTSFLGAFVNPLHVFQTTDLLVNKDRSLEAHKKITDLVASTLAALELAAPEIAPKWSLLVTGCKFLSEWEKTAKADMTFRDLTDFFSSSYTKAKADAAKSGIDPNTLTFSFLFVTEKVSSVVMSTTQVFIFAQKYMPSEALTTVSAEFVSLVGSVAAATGSDTVVWVCQSVTDVGIGTINKYSVVVFLAIQAKKSYHEWSHASSAGEGAKAVLNELKTVETLGKIVTITMVLSGVGTPVIITTTLVVNIISLTTQVQKDLAK
ncbi:MAG: hypothetical protein KDK48_03970 [Chlamydiia bacterium]|nr:hypothetical protein [Chlamydiia bacterium]